MIYDTFAFWYFGQLNAGFVFHHCISVALLLIMIDHSDNAQFGSMFLLACESTNPLMHIR